MVNYIINKNKDENGLNEVHETSSCVRLPAPQNQVPLGSHGDEIIAVAYAKTHGWTAADGCLHCCPKAHHG